MLQEPGWWSHTLIVVLTQTTGLWGPEDSTSETLRIKVAILCILGHMKHCQGLELGFIPANSPTQQITPESEIGEG